MHAPQPPSRHINFVPVRPAFMRINVFSVVSIETAEDETENKMFQFVYFERNYISTFERLSVDGERHDSLHDSSPPFSFAYALQLMVTRYSVDHFSSDRMPFHFTPHISAHQQRHQKHDKWLWFVTPSESISIPFPSGHNSIFVCDEKHQWPCTLNQCINNRMPIGIFSSYKHNQQQHFMSLQVLAQTFCVSFASPLECHTNFACDYSSHARF